MRLIFRRRRPIYKQGKLSGGKRRFSVKKINPTVLIVSCCILATFIFAVILGNILGNVAKDSESDSRQTEKPTHLSIPAVSLRNETVPDIAAYSVDLGSASSGESLSVWTKAARNLGNAIFLPIKDGNGNIIYTSEKTKEFSFPSNPDLNLEKIKSHFTYEPADYVCAYFKSSFGTQTSPAELLDTQNREVSLLSEASEYGASEYLISFSGNINRENILTYQTYLLSLRMGCPNTFIGVEFSYSFFSSEDAPYLVSEIMRVSDFCSIDFSTEYEDNSVLEEKLSSCLYVSERYPCRIGLAYKNAEFFEETHSILDKFGIKNFIVSTFAQDNAKS